MAIESHCFLNNIIKVENKKEYWDIVASSKKNIQTFLTLIREERKAKLLFIAPYSFEKKELTHKQEKTISSAFNEGYYSVPKKNKYSNPFKKSTS